MDRYVPQGHRRHNAHSHTSRGGGAHAYDRIAIYGATSRPTYTLTPRAEAVAQASETYVGSVYTLEVAHNGPVDVRLNAAGAATDRLTDVLPDQALAQPQ